MSWCSCAAPIHTHKSQQIRKNVGYVGKGRRAWIAKRREEIPSNAPNRRSNLHFRLFKPAFRKHYIFISGFGWTLVTEPCINLWRYSGESDYTARNNRLQPKMEILWKCRWRVTHMRGPPSRRWKWAMPISWIRMIATIFSFHSIGTIYFASDCVDGMQDYSLADFLLLSRLSIYQFN